MQTFYRDQSSTYLHSTQKYCLQVNSYNCGDDVKFWGYILQLYHKQKPYLNTERTIIRDGGA